MFDLNELDELVDKIYRGGDRGPRPGPCQVRDEGGWQDMLCAH